MISGARRELLITLFSFGVISCISVLTLNFRLTPYFEPRYHYMYGAEFVAIFNICLLVLGVYIGIKTFRKYSERRIGRISEERPAHRRLRRSGSDRPPVTIERKGSAKHGRWINLIVKYKSELSYLLSVVAVILLYFHSRDLFSGEPVVQKDFSIKIYEMNRIALLLRGGRLFGYLPDFYTGFYGFPFLTPGYPVMGGLFIFLGGSYLIYNRLMIFGGILFYGLVPLFFARMIGLDRKYYPFLLFWFINDRIWSSLIRYGLIHDLIALDLILASALLLLHKAPVIAEGKPLSLSRIWPVGYLIALSVLMHVVFSLYIAVLYPVIVIFGLISGRKSTGKLLRAALITALKIIGAILLIDSFWIVVLLMFKDLMFISPEGIVSFGLWNPDWNTFFYRIFLEDISPIFYPFIFTAGFVIFGGIIGKKRKNRVFRNEDTFNYDDGVGVKPSLPEVLIIVLFGILNIVFIFLALFYTTPLVLFGRTVFALLPFLPAVILKGSEYLEKHIFGIKRLGRPLTVVLFIYLGLSALFAFDKRIMLSEDYTGVDPGVEKLFAKINLYNDNRSRFLLEDTFFLSEQVWGKGKEIALAPLYTDGLFIGGYFSPTNYFLYSRYTNFYSGIIFDRKIVSENREYILYTIRALNIRYIFAWSRYSLDFFGNLSGYFSEIDRVGNFTIYEFRDYLGSYCFTLIGDNITPQNIYGRINPLEAEPLYAGPGGYKFRLRNITEGSTVYISVVDLPNLYVYINGTPVAKHHPGSGDFGLPLDNFLGITVPFGGDILLEIRWEEPALPIFLNFVFISIFFGYPLIEVVRICRKFIIPPQKGKEFRRAVGVKKRSEKILSDTFLPGRNAIRSINDVFRGVSTVRFCG